MHEPNYLGKSPMKHQRHQTQFEMAPMGDYTPMMKEHLRGNPADHQLYNA